MDEAWVSQWSWQVRYVADHNPLHTIFNHTPEPRRADVLRRALAASRNPSGVRVFRFLENNDTPLFLTTHGLERIWTVVNLGAQPRTAALALEADGLDAAAGTRLADLMTGKEFPVGPDLCTQRRFP